MIELKTKIHDQYTLELKTSCQTESGQPINEFSTEIWLFIPENLQSNEPTYTSDSFYEDLKTRLRLKTPQYTPEELAKREALPYQRLQKAIDNRHNTETLRHQVSMTCNAIKSCLRDALDEAVRQPQHHQQLEKINRLARKMLENYRAIEASTVQLPETSRESYYFGLEFLYQQILHYYFHTLKGHFDSDTTQLLLDIQLEMERRNFALPHPDNPEANQYFLDRMAELKKYIESELYIRSHKKNSGYLLEQLLFMLAAGIAMAFAIFINYHTRNTANQYSLPIVLLMIVSYMFKDRIKDWVKSWFRNGAGEIINDRRMRLEMRGTDIGSARQGYSSLRASNAPEIVLQYHAPSSGNEEVLHYRRILRLKRQRITSLSHHPFSGVNEICRISFARLMRWMDNPSQTIFRTQPDGHTDIFTGSRTYHLQLIIINRFQKQEQIHHLTIDLNRKGIVGINIRNKKEAAKIV